MSKRNSGYTQLFAIVRVRSDRAYTIDDIFIPKILLDLDTAQKETDRLNSLNGGQGDLYFWRATRFHGDLQSLTD